MADRSTLGFGRRATDAVAIAYGLGTEGGRYLFPPDIEDRLDDRERRILARIERLRVAAEVGGAGALASDAPRPDDGSPNEDGHA